MNPDCLENPSNCSSQKPRNRFRMRSILILISGLILICTLFIIIDFKGILHQMRYKNALNHFLSEIPLQTGDLLYRRGSSFESLMVMMADRQGEYSHVGIVWFENDTAWIVHMEPSTGKTGNDTIRKETVKAFLDPDKSTQFALYRPCLGCDAKTPRLHHYVFQNLSRKTTFDHGYDAGDTTRLYCSELIRNAFMHEGIDLIESNFDRIGVFFSGISIILPSSLIRYHRFENIYTYP